MKELAVGIELFENIFTSSLNEIKKIPDFLWTESSSKGDSGRKSDTISLDGSHNIIKEFNNSFSANSEKCLKEYLNKYGTVYLTKESATLLRYGFGQGFSNHTDDHPKLSRRRISITYYANDDYEGGEIEFPRFNIKFKPSPNTLLIFPSSYVYNHIVHPVTDGTRYSIAQFLC